MLCEVRCVLCVVMSLLLVACSGLCVARCSLFVGSCSPFSVCLFLLFYFLFPTVCVSSCYLYVCRLLFVMIIDVCCSLCAVRCSLIAVC